MINEMFFLKIIYVFKIDCVNKYINLKIKIKKKLDWRLKYCLYITLRKKKNENWNSCSLNV